VIVDTSALVALALQEPHSEAIFRELGLGNYIIPAPVLIELTRVATGRHSQNHAQIRAFIARLDSQNVQVEPFTEADAYLAAIANEAYGTGNGRGGTLNMLDLMVYAVAKRMRLPILCTGKDFAATDAAIHPASRVD
jgi:ribonuclease VapC